VDYIIIPSLALCWLLKKCSFAVIGNSHKILSTLIETKHRFVQTDLFRDELKHRVQWIFIEVYSTSKSRINRNDWWEVIINKEIMTAI
jgi:hypothetical protein